MPARVFDPINRALSLSRVSLAQKYRAASVVRQNMSQPAPSPTATPSQAAGPESASAFQRSQDALRAYGGGPSFVATGQGPGSNSLMQGPAPRPTSDSDSDHQYTISTRSFAPPASFGGGFQGDSRGFSTSRDVTSRIHSEVSFDANDATQIGPRNVTARSDPSIHHAIPFYKPAETPTVKILSEDVTHTDTVSTIAFETRHSGKDAVLNWLPGNPAPSLDVNTDLQVVSDRAANTLRIQGEITGDNFPATEVFIEDGTGQAVFLATGQPGDIATPAVNLLDFGIWDRAIADVDVTINTDDAGNFVSVNDGGETVDIGSWNARFQTSPSFTDPFAPINEASLEIREGYGEVGRELVEGWREVATADGVFATTGEVGEAVVETAWEVGEAGVETAAGMVRGQVEVTAKVLDKIIPGDGFNPFD